ncbi:MAG: response regulator [Nitrospirae bacterium]|nr:response regulator [Candidatus Manganitrophaceae bacterium]
MARVLILEDEEMLRTTMVRGISKLPNIEVSDAGTLEEALSQIDAEPPQMILSDLNLPGRSGVELLGELEKRKIHIPVVYITAFLNTFKTMIPMHANVKVLEKPVGLNELRSIVLEHTKKKDIEVEPAPFGVPDYLQLAGMGRYSVSITVQNKGEIVGKIIVVSGEVWSAQYELQGGDEEEGKVVFCNIAFLTGAHVSCQALVGDRGVRNIHDGWESLLMDAAREADERNLQEHEKGNTPNSEGEDALQEGKIDEDLDAIFAEEE